MDVEVEDPLGLGDLARIVGRDAGKVPEALEGAQVGDVRLGCGDRCGIQETDFVAMNDGI